ncbi:MAG: hydrogenase nickel incorporation protein HypB [Candidatus Eisenbacteria bacterium]|nr:hydrogenase nickel incorporation protein HypB [Candidatus Eisenbacteria bacterium]
MKEVKVLTKVLKANDMIAAEIRSLLDLHAVPCLNLMSSPGAGKTTLLEKTAKLLSGSLSLAAIEGDVATSLDGERLNAVGIPTVQVNTGGGCHLDATMIKDALQNFDLDKTDLLFIENVGNLICPSTFDLGEHVRVVLLSLPEGEDKPLKYPAMFLNSSVLVLSKVDMVGWNVGTLAASRANALKVNPRLKVFEVSSTEGTGLKEWADYLRALVVEKKRGKRD